MVDQEKTVLTRRRGPKPTGKGQLIGIRLQPDLLDALDADIESTDCDMSRPEAVRRILAEWLEQRGLLRK
jgi:metal-responsive CopG/Arc/MetJ family transcriptional regulator